MAPELRDLKAYQPDLDETQFDHKSYCDHLSPTAIAHIEGYLKINWEKEIQVRYYGLDEIESRQRQIRWWIKSYISSVLNQHLRKVADGYYHFDVEDDESIIVNGEQ